MRKLLIIYFLLLSLISNATTYYVATTGNDANAGTIAAPFATWQKGVDVAIPGDSVIIRGGVYLPTSRSHNTAGVVMIRPAASIGMSGTPGNPIVYEAYPGETPILDCKNVILSGSDNFLFGWAMEYVEYIYIKGLTIRNLYQQEYPDQVTGFTASSCANLKFENCTVHNISGRGFWYESGYWPLKWGANPPFDSDTTYYINCDASMLCDSIDNTTQVNPRPGNAADGFKFINYDSCIVYFTGCRAWDYTDDGFDPNPFGRAIFNQCWAFSSRDTIIYNGTTYTVEGNGIKVGARIPTYLPYPFYPAMHLSNCIAADIYGYGFYNNIESESENKGEFYNNLAYQADIGFAEALRNNEDTVHSVYRNNISFDNKAVTATEIEYVNAVGHYVYTQSHNNWIRQSGYPYFAVNDTITVTEADFVSLDVSQLSGARQADGSLPVITFGHLAATSDLINAGKDVGLPYDGTAPDIGAFEYDEGNTSPLVNTGLQTALSIRRATARGTVTSDGGATVTERGICYGTSANPTTSNSKVIVAGTTGAFSVTLTGLLTNTTYHVRSYAINSEGTSYGADETFTTPAYSLNSSPTGKITMENGKIIINR